MVKKSLLYIFLAASLSLAVLLSWLFLTTGGAEFFMAGVSKSTSVKIEISGAEGRLAGDIFFEKIKIKMDEITISARDFSLVWSPVMLLRGKIQIQEISVTEFLIDDDSDERSDIVEILRDIERAFLPVSKFKTELYSVKAENISYLKKGVEGFSSDLISLSLFYKSRLLEITDIEFKNNQLYASGSAGFSFPSYLPYIDIQIKTAEPVIGFEKFRVVLRPEDTSTLSNLSINAGSAKKEIYLHSRFEFNGKDMLNIETLNIAEAPGGSLVNISAEINFVRNFSKIIARLTTLELKTANPYPEMDVAGVVAFELDAGRFNGSYSLENRSEDVLKALKTDGMFEGDLQTFSIDIERALWLGGKAEGNVGIDIDEDYNINADLVFKDIDPSSAFAGYEGNINLNLEGFLRITDDKSLASNFKGIFTDSEFLDRGVSGFFDILLKDDDIEIKGLELHGSGFDIKAEGALEQKVGYIIDVEDFGALLPDAKGLLKASGHLKYFEDILTGEILATASGIEALGLSCSSLNIEAARENKKEPLMNISIEASEIVYEGFDIDKLRLNADGELENHSLVIDLQNRMFSCSGFFKGGYKDAQWIGIIDKLNVDEKNDCRWSIEEKTALSAGRVSFNLASFIMQSTNGEIFRIKGEGTWNPLFLNMQTSWDKLDIARAELFIENLNINGHSSGSAEIISSDMANPCIFFQTKTDASLAIQDIPLKIEDLDLDLTMQWTGIGLQSALNINIDNTVKAEGEITSDQPSRLSFPSEGTINLEWGVLDLEYFKDLFPEKVELAGQAKGRIVSEIMYGYNIDMKGEIAIIEGIMKSIQQEGIITSKINSAQASFSWKNQSLSGSCLVTLEDYGRIDGKYSLPIKASPPFGIYRHRDIDIFLHADVREHGLLSYIFPDSLQESSGKVDAEIKAEGSFENPSIKGRIKVADVHGYLPQTGITIKDAGIKADFKGNEIVLDSLYLCSGSGCINGSGHFYIKDARIQNFNARLTGKNFQAVYLPELQVYVNPDLLFEGSFEKFTVRGEIALPSVLFSGTDTKSVVKPSRDVVIIEEEQNKKPEEPVAEKKVDMEIMIPLGDDVRIKAEGIDARLEGSVKLSVKGGEDITAKGEIRVAEGTYTGGGTRLNITKGSLVFDDSPVDEPSVNVIALRRIGEVKAGVQITGMVRDPIVRLYSEPSMSETDVLGYIVLGRPIGQDSGQFSMLMVAASTLLSRGEVLSLQEGIRKKFRLDVIDIEPGETEGEGSALTIGKYLNPDIYVSIGYSVFTGSSIAKVRYSLTDKWQVESSIGQESGADLFYRIELK